MLLACIIFCLAPGFGIGSMIKDGLHFGEYFEMTSSPECDHVLYGIRPIVHLCFTFIQLYFVFLNSKVICLLVRCMCLCTPSVKLYHSL